MALVGTVETELRARVDRLEQDLRRGKAAWTEYGGAVSGSLQKLAIGLTGINQSIQLLSRGAEAAKSFGASFIEASAQVEATKTRLVGLMGSASAAAQEYARVVQLAKTTPFDLRGVAQADVTLKSFGDRSNSTLKAVADLAAFMGTDVVEAAAAYGRAFAAGAGAADILRERGVLALIQTKTGIADLTKLTLPDFRRALQETMVDPMVGIAGSTDRLAQTWNGRVSNMADAADQLRASLGSVVTDSDAAKSGLANIAGLLDDAAKKTDAWVAANRPLIEQKLGGLFAGIESGLQGAPAKIEAVGGAISSLGKTWESLPGPLKAFLLLTGGFAVGGAAAAGGLALAGGGSAIAVAGAGAAGLTAGSYLDTLGNFDLARLNDIAVRMGGGTPPVDQNYGGGGIDDASFRAIEDGLARPIRDANGRVVGVEPIDNTFVSYAGFEKFVPTENPDDIKKRQQRERQERIRGLQADVDVEAARFGLLEATGVGGDEATIRAAFEERRTQMERQHEAELRYIEESVEGVAKVKQLEAERLRQKAQLIGLAHQESAAVGQLQSTLGSVRAGAEADLIARYDIAQSSRGVFSDIASVFGFGGSVTSDLPAGAHGPPLPPDMGGSLAAAQGVIDSLRALNGREPSTIQRDFFATPTPPPPARQSSASEDPAEQLADRIASFGFPSKGKYLSRTLPERSFDDYRPFGEIAEFATDILLRDPKTAERIKGKENEFNRGRADSPSRSFVGNNLAYLGMLLGLSQEDVGVASRQFAVSAESDITTTVTRLAAARSNDLSRLERNAGFSKRMGADRVGLEREDIDERFRSDLVAIAQSFSGVGKAIDGASLAMAAFGKEGEITIGRLKRTVEDSASVIAGGIPAALGAAVQSGNIEDAATVMARQFSDTFTARLGERLLEEGPVAKKLTDAVRLGGDAASALARGDTAGFAALSAQARAAFMGGQQDLMQILGPIVGGARGFLGGLNPSQIAGLVDQTGISLNLPSYSTAGDMAKLVGGRPGQPALATVHGGEIVAQSSVVAEIRDYTRSTVAALTHMARNADGEGRPIVVILQQDGREVGRAIARDKKLQRSGVVLPVEVTRR